MKKPGTAAAAGVSLAGGAALTTDGRDFVTAADAQTSNGGGNGGMGNMPGMSGMATQQSTSTRGSIFDLVRAAIATAPFHSLDIAQKFGGYVAEVADKAASRIADPTVRAGTMGVHFLNPGLIDLNDDRTSVTPRQQAKLLVYEPMAQAISGSSRQYLILQKEWDATHRPAVTVRQEFMPTPADNRFGPAFYSLHAWIWKFNPAARSRWNRTSIARRDLTQSSGRRGVSPDRHERDGGPLCEKSRISRGVERLLDGEQVRGARHDGELCGWVPRRRAGVIEADRVVVARDHESGVGDAAQVVTVKSVSREHRLGLLEHHWEVLAPVR